MNYYLSNDIRSIERDLVGKYGVSEALLMENAGAAAALTIMRHFPGGTVIVLAGPGKNGGDGYVAARHLASFSGKRVEIFSAVSPGNLKGITEKNMKLAVQCGIPFSCSSDFSDAELAGKFREAGCLVDALLGIGAEGPLRGEIGRLCRLCTGAGNIVAFDIPTGVDPDSGKADRNAVRASLTIAMIAPKTGLATGEGRLLAGEIVTVGVGFPVSKDIAPRVRSFSEEEGISFLPRFPESIHKGMRGGFLVVGGSPIYRGAPLLSLRGGLRAGTGLAILFSDETSCAPCSASLPEAITETGLSEKSDGEIAERLAAWAERAETAVLGPGIGRSERAGEICGLVISSWKGRAVIDGDGLFWLAQRKEKLDSDRFLLTPHEGEAARLLGISASDVRENRISCARTIAETWGPVLLKGAETLIDDGRNTYVVASGDRSLAVPGSGDVLSGIIAAFFSAGMPLVEGAALGAFVHGKAGALLALSRGRDGLLAAEIADEIPGILKKMRN